MYFYNLLDADRTLLFLDLRSYIALRMVIQYHGAYTLVTLTPKDSIIIHIRKITHTHPANV